MNAINAHVTKVLEVARSRISHHLLQKVVSLGVRPGAIPTPESESKDDSNYDSGVGIGIMCS